MGTLRSGSGERAGAGQAPVPPEDPLSAAGRFASVAHEVALPLALASEAAAALGDDAARLVEVLGGAGAEEGVPGGEARALANRLHEEAEAIARGLSRAERLLTSYQRSLSREAHGASGGRIRLGACVRDALSTVEPHLRRRNLRAELIEVDAGLEVRGDAASLVQVVLNLVVNAARHAYPAAVAGRIEVTLARGGETPPRTPPAEGSGRAPDGPSPAARISVRDFGRGIAADVLPRIFERGFTTAASEGGTGLGLAIVKEIVEARLGGTIRCESGPGRGAMFEVRLPPA